ncbi:NAD(P)/FAD-dependent oxidoreductase [Mucilaginibacter paludis]|uniref:FAD-dependent pyridine nucleotide-disulfide oxidoreductase n=1 Tax=Mucilaginibacter paludis DSM 18603 TaxID=714943 RepID=H1Y6D6_9SPHI|nr:FAD-dependent oxidoreductase [Mucilaginibacter paludis]EHQ24884.1 FAD-dependent pyridine nucleotide-disulfide oxidoreductase [Mucilaginibacter paludis DSM 18603]
MENTKAALTTVKVYGTMESSAAYIIRDFLKRSVVTFDWIPVPDINALQHLVKGQIPGYANLPVVELPGGKLLFDPSIELIAFNLGWINKPKHTEYDVSIFGGGPAGLSAAVYAASEGLRTVLVEREAIGGQAGTSSRIENYLGFPDGISGAELAERARQQAVKFGVEILLMRKGVNAKFIDHKLHVDLVDGSKIIARANISATGVEYSRLNLPGENSYLDRGIYYGAGSSEVLLCTNEHVFIVGGGNSAGQAALNFCKHAKKVTMVIRRSDLASTLSFYLLNRIQNKKNIEVLYNSNLTALHGDGTLKEITITDTLKNTTANYSTRFVFVCIGGKPNTDWAKDTAIVRDEAGYLVTGTDLYEPSFKSKWSNSFTPAFLETSVPGCFAAGDVRHNSIKRVASAVGEGAMAVTFVNRYLTKTY